MTNQKKKPVILITGYLGSGKTTLMQKLLAQEQRKIALIVNDMGSINIDAGLLNKTGNKVAQVEMVELQNGCICCTLRDEFIAEIERISQEPDIEAVFVEASGISEPSAIAGCFIGYQEDNPDANVYLSSIVSVVDADRIYREFLNDLQMVTDTDEGDVINLVIDQIEFCNLILLNKTDLLDENQQAEVIRGFLEMPLCERRPSMSTIATAPTVTVIPAKTNLPVEPVSGMPILRVARATAFTFRKKNGIIEE